MKNNLSWMIQGMMWATVFSQNVFGQSHPGPTCLSLAQGQSVRETVEKAKLDEMELYTRLVFAEGISSNVHDDAVCKPQLEQVYESIAWGVINRVEMSERSPALRRKFGYGMSGVIFKEDQFNPSVSKKSKFSKVFLCPQRFDDWKNYWDVAAKVTRKVKTYPQRNPFLITDWERANHVSLVSHFYYPRSTQATARPPSWANISEDSKTFVRDLVISGVELSNRCIWFFRLEKPFPFLTRSLGKKVILKRLIQKKVTRLMDEMKEELAALEGDDLEAAKQQLPRYRSRWIDCVTDKVLDAASHGHCETFEKFDDPCVIKGGLTSKKFSGVKKSCKDEQEKS